MTQKQLSERLQSVGIDRSPFSVSNWETGRQNIPLDLIPAIATALEEKSLAKMYDLAGVVDTFNCATLIRMLYDASTSDIEYITEMTKTYFKHKANT